MQVSAARMIPKHFLESVRYESSLRTALQFAPSFSGPQPIQLKIHFKVPTTGKRIAKALLASLV